MKRYDFPLAVRGTLNDAAFLMKQKNIKPEFEENFTVRRRTFITAFTGATRSPNTFNISQMYSRAGVYKGKKNKKVGKDLQKQEYGGSVDRAAPRVGARVGAAYDKVVKGALFYRRLRNKQKANFAFRKSEPKGQFIKKLNNSTSAILTKDGRIAAAKRTASGVEWTTLYARKQVSKIRKSQFIKPAAIKTNKEIPRLFIENAEKRFKKAMK